MIKTINTRVFAIAFLTLSLAACRSQNDVSSGLSEDDVNPTIQALALTPEQIKFQSKYVEIDQQSPAFIQGATFQSLQNLLFNVKNDPVARLDRLSFYDPDGLTGFCFGRAMAVHLQARQMGIAPDSIKKQFIVGNLKNPQTNETEWRFHVATIIKSDQGVWYAVDPIFPQIMTADQWVQKARGIWDQWHLQDPAVFGEQSFVYTTDRHAILPDIRNFVAIELETGENLIELSFDPSNKPGFTFSNRPVGKTYALSTAASDKYFLSATEAVAADRFDFVGLNFEDGFKIHYNRYFGDLLLGVGIGTNPVIGITDGPIATDGGGISTTLPAPIPSEQSTFQLSTSPSLDSDNEIKRSMMNFDRIQSLRNKMNN